MYRYAVSLEQDMQLNDLRTALLNYIGAKQSKKHFIVRIEDIDKARKTEGKDSEILELLSIFDIKYDYLYYQSENFKYHLQFASSIMDKGKAFACFCTTQEEPYSGKCINISQQELLNNNLPFTIRIKKPTGNLYVKDSLQEDISFEADTVDSFIIMTQQKYPTAEFANACDDMLQAISHVICEEKDILDAPRQKLVKSTLGFNEEITYTHLPSITNTEDKSVKSLLDEGYLPESIINYLLAGICESSKEIFSLEEALEFLDLNKISTQKISFDINKLNAINREQIKLLDDMELSKILGYASHDIGKLAKLFAKTFSTTYEIKNKIDSVFSKKNSETYAKELDTLKSIIKNAPYFESYTEFETYLKEKSQLQDDSFSKPFSVMLGGEEENKELEEIYALMKNYLQEIAR